MCRLSVFAWTIWYYICLGIYNFLLNSIVITSCWLCARGDAALSLILRCLLLISDAFGLEACFCEISLTSWGCQNAEGLTQLSTGCERSYRRWLQPSNNIWPCPYGLELEFFSPWQIFSALQLKVLCFAWKADAWFFMRGLKEVFDLCRNYIIKGLSDFNQSKDIVL